MTCLNTYIGCCIVCKLNSVELVSCNIHLLMLIYELSWLICYAVGMTSHWSLSELTMKSRFSSLPFKLFTNFTSNYFRSFARYMSRNEDLFKAKQIMKKSLAHGAPSPKLSKMLEVLLDHFSMWHVIILCLVSSIMWYVTVICHHKQCLFWNRIAFAFFCFIMLNRVPEREVCIWNFSYSYIWNFLYFHILWWENVPAFTTSWKLVSGFPFQEFPRWMYNFGECFVYLYTLK